MAKRGVEEQLGSLARLREGPVTDATLEAVRKGLRDRVNLVAAKAAQIAGEMGLKPLIPELVTAFERHFHDGSRSDPQCWAKNAIAKTLTELDHDESAAFLRGLRYVQMEPVWGGKADTAVMLRSLCLLALVPCADLPRAEKLRHMVMGLADGEEAVRIDALRALEQMDGEEAALLLRLKVASGDKRATVVGQALESLLRLEGKGALDFAQEYLRERMETRELSSTPEEFVEEAAMAVGASRLPSAVEVLREAWTREPRVIFLQAISASRQEPGFEFLLGLVRDGRERDAAAALDALSFNRDSPEVRKTTLEAVEARGASELRERYEVQFGAG